MPDYARVFSLYDPLVIADVQNQPTLWLAEEISPEGSASSFIIKLRQGIEFHNGKTLGAEDVLFTFQRILNPKKPLEGALILSPIDLSNSKVLDKYTLRVAMNKPFASFVEQLIQPFCSLILPVGWDPKNPVGTGPFKFQSFTPGQQSVMVRNDNYWRSPEPYFDSVTVIDFADQTTVVNALLSGTIDATGQIPPALLSELKSNSSLATVVARTGGFTPITMRVDQAPFNDVRVRHAMKLLVDRPKLVEAVYGGNGIAGNDVFGITDPDYDTSLVRAHDPERAKSLLKQAGHNDLTTQLVVGPIFLGMVEMAEVFAQQAMSAGVTVSVSNVPYSTFYDSQYLQRPFSMDFWFANPYLAQAGNETVTGAAYNETHFNDAHYNSLYVQANATLDSNLRKELIHEMQQIDFDQGGLIIPAFYDVVDAFTTRLHGYYPYEVGGPVSNVQFRQMWFSK
jgi:peptide/nickel transport system substrate-binding protein